MSLFTKLITSESGTSSKRFMSLLSFGLLIIIIIADVWFGKDVNDIVYYTLGGLILGTSSMTVFQDNNYNKNINEGNSELK